MKKVLIVLLTVISISFGCLALSSCKPTPPSGNGVQSSSKLQFQRIAGKNEYRVIGIGMESELDIVIPSTYNALPVTEIGANAFNSALYITSVIIPDSITAIGEWAFKSCDGLTSIEIPDSVTSIGSEAFNGCTSLTSVVIGDSVTSIGSNAFSSCYSLTSIEIPDSVTSIGSYAFYECSSLTSVVIDDSVTSIVGWAFYECSSLKTVYYNGTAEEWAGISINGGNDKLTNATKYYYFENEEDVPTDGGNYWHYDENGEIAVW